MSGDAEDGPAIRHSIGKLLASAANWSESSSDKAGTEA